MFKEFKAFVNQGNALDLAVGVLIGAAFGKIVNSVVNDILTPIISLALGRVDFHNMYIPLNGQTAPVLETLEHLVHGLGRQGNRSWLGIELISDGALT